MSAESKHTLDRLHELLADQALVGLSAAESAELQALLALHPEVDPAQYDQLAAELHAELLAGSEEQLPTGLAEALERTALDEVAALAPNRASRANSRASRPGTARGDAARFWSTAVAWTGWVAAAALTLFVLRGRVEGPLDPAQARDRLIAESGDLVQADWAGQTDAWLAGGTVEGNVVWSDDAQAGYMVLRGLPVNDPSEKQYQLWIFDRSRSAEQPVDGGVFDVSSSGELVIPMRPTLGVREAFLFAVTLEEPGGVVVSEREHLLLLAQPAG